PRRWPTPISARRRASRSCMAMPKQCSLASPRPRRPAPPRSNPKPLSDLQGGRGGPARVSEGEGEVGSPDRLRPGRNTGRDARGPINLTLWNPPALSTPGGGEGVCRVRLRAGGEDRLRCFEAARQRRLDRTHVRAGIERLAGEKQRAVDRLAQDR